MTQLDQASDEADAILVKNETPVEKRALASVQRQLTDEELQQPGVQKLILDRLDLAEEQIIKLEKYRIGYYETSTTLAVTESSLKRITSLDTLQSTMLGIGCLILGYVPSAWGNWPTTIISALSGIAFVTASYLSKRRNS